MNWTYFPVSTLPTPYELVWCRFPHHESLGNPGPYSRPGLVRNTSIDANGNPAVQLVYGTSKLKLEQRKLDFFITKVTEMDACGLYRGTRFDLDQVHWLPWAEEWFETRRGYSSPVFGRLSDGMIYALQITVELRRRAKESAGTAKRRAASTRSKHGKSAKPRKPKPPA